MTFQIINPDSLGRPRGWNNGMLAPASGRVLFIAGQTARDANGVIVGGDDMAAQWAQALANVLAVVRAAGGGPENIGRMTVFVTDRDQYVEEAKAIGVVWRAAMGRHYPAMSVVGVNELVDDGALVEIEATAVI
jgi:enamine deaminase RidA (YjgF/YER057c/UK114 family)